MGKWERLGIKKLEDEGNGGIKTRTVIYDGGVGEIGNKNIGTSLSWESGRVWEEKYQKIRAMGN